MMMHNGYSEFVVQVNGGSGCLFKVYDADYMYILTAKHVIENKKVAVNRQWLDEANSPREIPLTVIGTPYLHTDPHKDAALFKVALVPEVASLPRLDDPLDPPRKMTLAGFPNSRSEKKYAYRMDELVPKNRKAYGYIECQMNAPSAYGDILGLSGGGVFFSVNNQHYLAGVQSQMAAEDEEEMLSNVDMMPLSFFDEIIAQNPGLAPLDPEYLQCFSVLRNCALKLEGCFGAIQMQFTRNYLQDVTDDIISNGLTPTVIRDFFKAKLLVFEQSKVVLGSRGLWIAWLEFLIILNFIRDEKIDDQNIERVFNEVRLIYSDTEGDWTDELAKIFRSDFLGMPENATVIVATQHPPAKCLIHRSVIPNIIQANPLTRKQMQIDVGLTHPLQNFRLMHLHAFQLHGIIDKEYDYYTFNALTEDQLFDKLKTEFHALLA